MLRVLLCAILLATAACGRSFVTGPSGAALPGLELDAGAPVDAGSGSGDAGQPPPTCQGTCYDQCINCDCGPSHGSCPGRKVCCRL